MKYRYLFAIVCSLLASSAANAQWHSDSTTNTPICTAGGTQQGLHTCSDGAEGLLAVWEDYRSNEGWDIWAQRLDANGNPLWGVNGAPVCRLPASDQRVPLIASDGAGGAFIVWEDYRTVANGVDLYAQRLQSNGVRVWDTSGVKVCAAIRDQNNASLCSDGNGNAFVAWEDNRATSSPTRPDIYMNKLTSSGVAWGTTGLLEINQSSQQKAPKLCDDGNGGCLLAWQSSSTIPQSIWAARITSAGAIMWSTQGIQVYKGGSNTNISKNVDLRRDGSQFLIAWEESTSTGQEIRANRLNLDSSKVWYNPADVTWSYPGDQTNPKIFSDDSVGEAPFNTAGVFVLFENNFGSKSIAMVRVLPNGSDLVPHAGTHYFTVCDVTGGQAMPAGAKVDNGTLLAAWDDARNGSGDSNVYAQEMDIVPRRYFPTVGTNSTWGKPIRYSTTSQTRNVSLVPRTGGAIAAWEDNRNGNYDIYAQLIFKNGTLPVEMTHFTATARGAHVDLNWQTASEQGNAGFIIERKESTNGSLFQAVQSYSTNEALRGHGPTSVTHDYDATDYPPRAGSYDYRIVDVSLSGARTEHPAEHVELGLAVLGGYALMQNQPNPVLDHTTIGFSLEQSAIVDLSVMDILGRVVARPLAHQFFTAGTHSTGIDLTQAGERLATGTYLYRMIATDPVTGSIVWQNAKAMSMQIVR